MIPQLDHHLLQNSSKLVCSAKEWPQNVHILIPTDVVPHVANGTLQMPWILGWAQCDHGVLNRGRQREM